MKKLQEASQKAIKDTARFMTGQLRHHALNHGWDSDVVANMHVKYEEGKFNVKVHPDYAERAFKHEYGTEDKKPTAVIRKYSNDTAFAEKAYLMSLHNHVGGVL